MPRIPPARTRPAFKLISLFYTYVGRYRYVSIIPEHSAKRGSPFQPHDSFTNWPAPLWTLGWGTLGSHSATDNTSIIDKIGQKHSDTIAVSLAHHHYEKSQIRNENGNANCGNNTALIDEPVVDTTRWTSTLSRALG